jgi:NAD-dependent deacetylase
MFPIEELAERISYFSQLLRENEKPIVIVLSGAGLSAESGISTFRDANGLWEGHDITEVASPVGWKKNPQIVLDFYNKRRLQLAEVEPNAAHQAIVELESEYCVIVITQNVDNLHERAGSKHILHLHGELSKVRSTADPNLIYDIGATTISLGDTCEKGSQLRPHIVWFQEEVPMMTVAQEVAAAADVLVIVGTSMQVYPAASLATAVPKKIPKFCIDRRIPDVSHLQNLTAIEEVATVGIPKLVEKLLKEPISVNQS